MSYRSEQEENTLWISLAGVWLAIAAASFLWVFFIPSPANPTTNEAPSVLGLGVVILAITFTLRLPTLAKSQQTSVEQEHLVWLLTLAASTNWFGFLASYAPSLPSTTPLLMLFLGGEVLWLVTCKHEDKLRWLSWRPQEDSSQNEVSPLESLEDQADETVPREPVACEIDSELERRLLQNAGTPNQSVPHDDNASIVNGDVTEEQVDHEAGEFRSTFRSGFSEEGQQFALGENRVHLETGQKSSSLAILFNPAFPNPPAIEIEIDQEEIRTEVLRVTPSGARILLKRSKADAPMQAFIQWYATETLEPINTDSELP